MPSQRAENVAEILFLLKRLDKLATFTEIARHAGFRAGVEGKQMTTCLEAVRRDWPHLDWWRAIPDTLQLESEGDQALCLQAHEFEMKPGRKDGQVLVAETADTFVSWEVETSVGEE